MLGDNGTATIYLLGHNATCPVCSGTLFRPAGCESFTCMNCHSMFDQVGLGRADKEITVKIRTGGKEKMQKKLIEVDTACEVIENFRNEYKKNFPKQPLSPAAIDRLFETFKNLLIEVVPAASFVDYMVESMQGEKDV